MSPAPTHAALPSQARTAWAFVVPFFLVLSIFVLGPTLAVIGLSVSDWKLGEREITFVGLQNYDELFGDRIFWNSAQNTAVYTLMVVPVSVALGVWLAVLIESSRLGRTFFRSAIFLPVVSTTVAMAVVWEFLLHPTLGPVNTLIGSVGVPPQRFLSDAKIVLVTLAAIGVWETAGYVMVLVLAGLKSIPSDLYDAAAVDGAHRPWERFWTVTWPLLGPTMVFVTIIAMLRAIRVFETVAALTQGGPRRASEVVLFTIYQEGITYFRIGYASALTVVFLLVLLVLTAIQFRVLDRRAHYG
ncbi:MAG: sugar ABC transporter permease [Pseudomonadota bacterium]